MSRLEYILLCRAYRKGESGNKMETGNEIKLETEIETQSLSFCTPSKMHMLAFIAEHPRALSTY